MNKLSGWSLAREDMLTSPLYKKQAVLYRSLHRYENVYGITLLIVQVTIIDWLGMPVSLC